MENHVHEDEIDDIASALQLSLLDINDEQFVATDENGDEDIRRAIEESLKNLSYDQSQRRGHIGNRRFCDVCEKIKSSTEMGMLEFWNQIFCLVHLVDDTPRCCGCRRLKMKEMQCIKLSDDREICKNCYSVAILDDKQCRPLVQKCYQFFEKLNMKLRDDISFYLVDKLEMTSLSSDGSTTIEKIVGKRIKVEHSKHKGHGCGITIVVLFGLPKIMTGAILAHEMMHAWLRLKNVKDLEAKVEEGICQVIGRKWLDMFEAETASGSSSRGGSDGGGGEEGQFVKNLMETFKHEVETDSSKAYGEGFREAQWAVAKYGFEFTINHIVTRGTLP